MAGGRPTDYSDELAERVCEAIACIYGLYDRNGNLRYIGKANNPDKRLASHMRDARRRRTPLYDWINKHGKPEMRVIESGCKDWREAEKRLIGEARSRGDMLLNVASGGDEPHCPADVRKANGSKLANAVRLDPKMKFMREAKRTLTQAVNKGWADDNLRFKMRLLAAKMPDVFGEWRHMPDRNANV